LFLEFDGDLTIGGSPPKESNSERQNSPDRHGFRGREKALLQTASFVLGNSNIVCGHWSAFASPHLKKFLFACVPFNLCRPRYMSTGEMS